MHKIILFPFKVSDVYNFYGVNVIHMHQYLQLQWWKMVKEKLSNWRQHSQIMTSISLQLYPKSSYLKLGLCLLSQVAADFSGRHFEQY